MLRYLFFLLIPIGLIADSDPIRIRSLFAESKDNSMLFYGDVHIENASSEITSEEASVISHENRLLLRDHVNIHRKAGETIECGAADLELESLKGHFRENVVLKEEDAGLLLQCQDLNAELADGNETLLKELIARGDVHIDYAGEMTADGAFMHYRFDPNLQASYPDSIFPGSAILRPSSDGFCTVQTPSRDIIHAKEFRMNLPSKAINCDQANGSIYDQRRGEPLNFWARRVYWDQREHYLVLTEDIILEHASLGKLHSDREIQVRQKIVGNKKILSEIYCLGATRMRSTEVETGEERILHCFKSLYIDNEKGVSILESPKINGHTPLRKQVHYKDRVGEITADRVQISYLRSPKGLRVDKVLLEGQVQMENFSSVNPKDDTPVHQYALADQVELYPREGRMEMHAHAGNTVIFYDQIKEMQISAPAIYGSRDGVSGEESLRGQGNVRMTLAQDEIELLKSRFQGIR